jgi:hypothetical protein
LNANVQTFNESKNSLPHTFTLKLDTFKKPEEISSTPLTHLENGLLLSLHPCKLKAFPQTQTPFFHTPQTFNESKNSLPHTFTLKLDTFKKLEEQDFHI